MDRDNTPPNSDFTRQAGNRTRAREADTLHNFTRAPEIDGNQRTPLKRNHMAMLSVIPADTVLTVAIQDATVRTSTVNPARITSAVQKMRPDWCVNKRRVKRLLRSMNNDAWKAAVNPTVTAGNPAPARGGSDVAGTPSSYSSAETDAPPPPPPAAATETATTRSSSRAAAKAAKAAEKAVRLAEKAAAKTKEKAAVAAAKAATESASMSMSPSSTMCETAPASPGSPASTVTVAAVAPTAMVLVRSPPPPPPPLSLSDSPSKPADAATTADGATAEAAGAPWDGEVNGVEASGSDEQEALSESLDLKPDLELEPGVDLTADLGIVTNIAAAAAAALTTEGIPECDAADTLSAGGDIGVSGRSEAADNLGFEMIDKAEVVGAAAAAAAAASSSSSTTPSAVGAGSDSGAASTGKFRKGWPWAWTRSS